MALCVRVFCVLFLYLAHTFQNPGGHARGAAACADGLGSATSSDEQGTLSSGDACLDTDAILPRFQENDPFLAFLSLAALLPPLRPAEASGHLRAVQPRSADRRPPDALHPHLRLLAHASQILC